MATVCPADCSSFACQELQFGEFQFVTIWALNFVTVIEEGCVAFVFADSRASFLVAPVLSCCSAFCNAPWCELSAFFWLK